MSKSYDSIEEPIPISLIAGRYLLFDINVVTYLRSTHKICGVLTGTLPQMPQQNVFLGLPVELMPEEARLLVEQGISYIIDDAAWHRERFTTFEGADRQQYLDTLRAAGLNARRYAEATKRLQSEQALAKVAALRLLKSSESSVQSSIPSNSSEVDSEESFFHVERPKSRASIQTSPSDRPWPVTPTTTLPPLSKPHNRTQQPLPPVPSSYSLFAHLHSRKYYLMPGLRFGCDYNVYPGDPLRFHSHFTAVSYDWDEEISMLDLVGGGRLGTRVKKGFLIGGQSRNSKAEGDNVRTFCIEWGGM
jgi:tRNA-splicing endonuclease subunit Sen34